MPQSIRRRGVEEMRRSIGAILIAAILAGVALVGIGPATASSSGVAAAAILPTLNKSGCPPPPPYVAPGSIVLTLSPAAGKIGATINWRVCGVTPVKQFRVQVIHRGVIYRTQTVRADWLGRGVGSFKIPRIPGRPDRVTVNVVDIKTGVWLNRSLRIIK